MNVKSLLLAFFLGALLAGGITYFVVQTAGGSGSTDLARESGDGDSDAPLPAVALTGTEDPSSTADATLKGSSHAQERLAQLELENQSLESELENLQEQVERLTPKPKDPRAFRFGLPQKAPTFDGADWPKLAGYMSKLAPLLGELREAFAEGKDPSPAWRSKVMQYNTPLAQFAIKASGDLDDEKAPNANAAYTHPAVFANLMRASLATAQMPLSDDQEIAIQALGDAWSRDHDRSRASIPETAPMLKHTVLEVDAKLRFLGSVKSVLTADQVNVLFQPETEGRMHLDLLSPVLVYSPVSVPLQAESREDMETKLIAQLLGQTGVETEDLSKFAWIGRQWVDAIPGVTDPQVVTAVEFRCPHVDIVQHRARAQVQATERILAMGGLTEKQATALRGMTMLLYPFILQGGS